MAPLRQELRYVLVGEERQGGLAARIERENSTH
jgi:hypothetical protein